LPPAICWACEVDRFTILSVLRVIFFTCFFMVFVVLDDL
jgi:hypothetical protein